MHKFFESDLNSSVLNIFEFTYDNVEYTYCKYSRTKAR